MDNFVVFHGLLGDRLGQQTTLANGLLIEQGRLLLACRGRCRRQVRRLAVPCIDLGVGIEVSLGLGGHLVDHGGVLHLLLLQDVVQVGLGRRGRRRVEHHRCRLLVA